ncbi:unnamed protein product [Chilo suppressalis]|uniref:Protein kinase domain-containing protein n=1 Tax=Chilo suppressalis TaxID=168631 RepID=A0ABN8B0U8_CHISP|nr:unnamed protein product [Chilo suppressalis]
MIIVRWVEILNLELSVNISTNTSVIPVDSFRMADNRYYRSKSPKKYKREEFSRPKMKKSKHYKHKEENKRQVECKTPPLPSSTSLDELLKQRENLKEELEKITKQSKFDLEIRPNLNEIKYNNVKTSQHGIKRIYVNDKDITNIKRRRHDSMENQDSDDSHLDSDDEENIIELRRKQRKELLEKLNSSCTNKPSNLAETNSLLLKNDHDNNQNNEQTHKNSDNSVSAKETTDMFAEKDFSNSQKDVVKQDNSNTELSDNWDDAEGYYNVKIGDIIDNNKYTVKSILGQGVFANVILAQDNKNKLEVAIKVMRNNEVIYKTGLKELALLKEINEADPENKHHCIKFLRNFMHKGHLCVVLEPLYMDMRKVIKKYGKHTGLNMKAVTSYSRQLLLALRLLKKMGIIHADVKPDNILVNEKKNILKLCDFGSASKVDENEITPYLVSRFYRAPEIILGLPYKHGIDIWSAGCTIFEMTTGKIMFTGSSNNKMLKCFMDLKGKIPSKLIRKAKFKDQHFNYNNSFLLHKKDEISGREKFVELSSINPTRDLLPELKKCYKNVTEEVETKLAQLKDMLEKMLVIDSNQRFSVNDCLKHPFIQENFNK